MCFKHLRSSYAYQAQIMYIGSETDPLDSILARNEQNIRYDRVCTASYAIQEKTILDMLIELATSNGVSFIGLYAVESPVAIFTIRPSYGILHHVDKGSILFSPLAHEKLYRTCPIHELTHRSTDGSVRLNRGTIMRIREKTKLDTVSSGLFLDLRTNTIHCYYDNPCEVTARLNALRYILYQAGIYDPRYQEFKKEYLSFTQKYCSEKNPEFDTNVADLLSIASPDDLVWLMNNID